MGQGRGWCGGGGQWGTSRVGTQGRVQGGAGQREGRNPGVPAGAFAGSLVGKGSGEKCVGR